MGFMLTPLVTKFFLAVESDTREQLVKFLDPVIDLCDYEVSPFLNFSTAIASLSNN